jgi:predicted Zn-dependent protease
MKVCRYSIFKRFTFAVLFSSIISCTTATLPSIGSADQPSQIEEDEKELQKDADWFERKFEKGSFFHKDPDLEAYLNGLVQKLLPPGIETQTLKPRIRIIKSPRLDAFASPNGAIYVCTGILVNMENEAQLATILGHELVHILKRHTLKKQSTIPQYSQEMEKEADEEGLRAIARAGFDPKEAPKALEHLIEERNSEKIEGSSSLASHPPIRERIENYRTIIRMPALQVLTAANPVIGCEEFEKRIGGLLLDNAVKDMDLGRFKLARKAIERRLRQNSQDPRAYFLMGELYRKSGKGDHQALDLAMSAYQTAIRLNPIYADPHREIGFLYRMQNLKEKWRAEFEEYLSLNPKAIDAPIIRGYLDQQQ